jgi:hypothetical protein
VRSHLLLSVACSTLSFLICCIVKLAKVGYYGAGHFFWAYFLVDVSLDIVQSISTPIGSIGEYLIILFATLFLPLDHAIETPRFRCNCSWHSRSPCRRIGWSAFINPWIHFCCSTAGSILCTRYVASVSYARYIFEIYLKQIFISRCRKVSDWRVLLRFLLSLDPWLLDPSW